MTTIAVTGASGRLGARVATLLGPRVSRLILRDSARAPRVEGDPELRVATYDDFGASTAACDGVEVLLMVSAAESPRRLEDHRTMVRAAAAAGVRHVVYTSFDGAAPDADFTLGRDHWHTEEAIRDSGMAYTFLRDSFYLDVLPSFADEGGTIRGPAGSGRVAAVARDDVADVAVAVLADPDEHAGTTVVLTGPEALTVAEAAERLTRALGRPIGYRDETVAEAYESRRHLTSEQWQLDAWVSTYTAIASGRMAAVSEDVPRITGHPARTLEDVFGAQRSR